MNRASLYDLNRIDFSLQSVTHDRSKAGSYQVNDRLYCELIYKLDGEAYEIFDHSRITFSQDCILFIPETIKKNIFTVREPGTIINIHFHLTGSAAALPLSPEMLSLGPGNRYKSGFISAFEEWQKKDAGSYLRTHAIVSSILAGLVSDRHQQYMQSGKPAKIRPALEYIRAHFREQISIEMLSRMCGISDEYLRILAKHVTGLPPLSYINTLRLEAAYEMLQSGSVTVSEAAQACGFENTGYFSRLFKKRYNLSPSKVCGMKITLPSMFDPK